MIVLTGGTIYSSFPLYQCVKATVEYFCASFFFRVATKKHINKMARNNFRSTGGHQSPRASPLATDFLVFGMFALPAVKTREHKKTELDIQKNTFVFEMPQKLH